MASCNCCETIGEEAPRYRCVYTKRGMRRVSEEYYSGKLDFNKTKRSDMKFVSLIKDLPEHP